MNDAQLRVLLGELETFGLENDANQPDRTKKMLNLERDTAQLVFILMRSSKRQRILEIGTSNGFSTIWLAWAARANGGHVISLDRSAEKHQQANTNLKRAGLRDLVDLQTGDATEIIKRLDGPFDCVLFDADRISAPGQLEILFPKLSPGALVLADNVFSHPDEIVGYLKAVDAHQGFVHQVVPVGKGLSIAYLA